MKAKIMTVVAALLAGALHADEQYLYWMVDVADTYAFDYATVSTIDAGGKVSVLNNKSSGATDMGQYVWTAETDRTETTPVYAYDVTGYDSLTFLFELFSEGQGSDLRVAYKYVQGSALKDYIGIGMKAFDNPYVVTDVVPEPTSGMLLLLGVAGLALRRRRNGPVG